MTGGANLHEGRLVEHEMSAGRFFLPPPAAHRVRYLVSRGLQSVLMAWHARVWPWWWDRPANASAGRAFSLSTEAVTGRDTHQITPASMAFPIAFYPPLRRQGLVEPWPLWDDYVFRPAGKPPAAALGIDPSQTAPFS